MPDAEVPAGAERDVPRARRIIQGLQGGAHLRHRHAQGIFQPAHRDVPLGAGALVRSNSEMSRSAPPSLIPALLPARAPRPAPVHRTHRQALFRNLFARSCEYGKNLYNYFPC
jgi:hypothetical protein